MEKLCILIFVLFFVTNSLDKAESVKLELKTFDEIFGEGWWDKGEAEDLKMPAPTNFGQNVHHQIDRQNTQLGHIESNSTDQNPPLTESDHSDNTKNVEELNDSSNENITEDKRKRKIVAKFHAMRNEFKQKANFSAKEWTKIERKIAKHLKVSRLQIYNWKKEFGLSRKRHNSVKENNERKNLVEKFDQMKAELKRAGFKNSYNYEIDETVAKELGLNFKTIYAWKRELGQTTQNHKYSQSEQKELMKRYYAIKDQNPKMSDENIVKMLKIASRTLVNWKRQFKRQQFHLNSDDGHSVEENAAANVQEIENSNSESI
uniref:Uncharacterized protein n=1 Tax=Globodera rostochiensis TaxID=31243 RepID=A0A914HUR1_GLORO